MKRLLILLCTGIIYSCSSSDDNLVVNQSDWSIPINQVLDGGPGKDGIPALVNPHFTDLQNIDYLNDNDLVIGFKRGDDIRAYPHAILDWHEIVNDNIKDVSLAVTYCPLTGTGIGWNRILNGNETSFGVSGLLYNTNLIPFDRATNSNWSQILNEAVNGELKGKKADLIMLFETDWKTWKMIFPGSKVLSTNTGFSRTYGVSPYGDYSTNNDLFLFPVPKDNRLPSKERVHAITDGESARAYRFSQVISNGNIIRDSFKGKEYLVTGNENFIVSFRLDSSLSSLDFEYVFNGSQVILRDSEANEWNVFGEAVSGPRKGKSLGTASSFMGFWFSIPAFYTTEIFSN